MSSFGRSYERNAPFQVAKDNVGWSRDHAPADADKGRWLTTADIAYGSNPGGEVGPSGPPRGMIDTAAGHRNGASRGFAVGERNSRAAAARFGGLTTGLLARPSGVGAAAATGSLASNGGGGNGGDGDGWISEHHDRFLPPMAVSGPVTRAVPPVMVVEDSGFSRNNS